MRNLLLLVVLSLVETGCSDKSQHYHNLPKLLEKVGAGGSNPCPPRSEQERKIRGIGGEYHPSEIDKRLAVEFPVGASGYEVATTLINQGFNVEGSCESDATIRRANYFQKGKGFLPYDIYAGVYWKLDDKQRIVWIKGSVGYSGL